jgi:putative membrane protein
MRGEQRGLWVVLGVLVLIVFLLPLLGGGMMGPGMMGRSGPAGAADGYGWPWGLAMGLGGLMMLAFWGAVLVGVVLLVRGLIGPGSTSGRTESGRTEQTALEVLKRRYAAGEITREQFDDMRRVLES